MRFSIGLRDEEARQERLRSILAAYNFRLQPPARNITTEQGAKELFEEEFTKFLADHKRVKDSAGKAENCSHVKWKFTMNIDL